MGALAERVYLDHAATTPLDRRVLEEMLPYFTGAFGNPSSQHAFGRAALDAVERARQDVASLVGGRPREVLFTGGGTEADNLALRGVFHSMRRRGRHVVVVSAVEHEAVLETARSLVEEAGAELRLASVDRQGRVDLEALGAMVDARTAIVSVMRAQNETGVLEDVAGAARIAHAAGAVCHSDAVAAALGWGVDAPALGADLVSVSAHKIYGPKGVGALWVREGVELLAATSGGGQERGRRAGTHNVPAIVGFGAAARLLAREGGEWRERMRAHKEELWRRLSEVEGLVRTGAEAETTAGTLHVRAPGAPADSLLIGLDGEGVAVSAGSACSALAVRPSHVLAAMGLGPDEASSGIRFSLGAGTTADDVERAAGAYAAVVRRVRRAQAARVGA